MSWSGPEGLTCRPPPLPKAGQPATAIGSGALAGGDGARRRGGRIFFTLERASATLMHADATLDP